MRDRDELWEVRQRLTAWDRVVNRFLAVRNCLMGRPTMYRMTVEDGTVLLFTDGAGRRTAVIENTFRINRPMDALYIGPELTWVKRQGER